jgi:hypothetical protein
MSPELGSNYYYTFEMSRMRVINNEASDVTSADHTETKEVNGQTPVQPLGRPLAADLDPYFLLFNKLIININIGP